MSSVRFLATTNVPAGERERTSARAVAEAWLRVTSSIPAYVAVGMAERESNFTLNEEDTEDSGYVSTGIFQLGSDTRRSAMKRGLLTAAAADFCTLDDSCKVLACVLEGNLSTIIAAATDANARGLGKSPYDSTGTLIPDVWAYLAVSHNIGMGSSSSGDPYGRGVMPGINAFGLSWPDAFTRAHPSMGDRQVRYGNTAMSGGSQWTADLGALLPSPAAGIAAKVERGGVLFLLLAIAGLLLAVGWRSLSKVVSV